MIALGIKALFAGVSWVKVGLIFAAVIAVVTAGGIIYHNIWERGYARAIADIAKQDQKAIARASTARSVVLDCRARGVRYDQSTGLCERR